MEVSVVFVTLLVLETPGGSKVETTMLVSIVVTKPTGKYELVTTFAKERR